MKQYSKSTLENQALFADNACFLTSESGDHDITDNDPSLTDYIRSFNSQNHSAESGESSHSYINSLYCEIAQEYRKNGHKLASIYGSTNPSPESNLDKLLTKLYNINTDCKVIVDPYTSAESLASEMISTLNKVYTNKIGFEFSHLESPNEIVWLQNHVEKSAGNYNNVESGDESGIGNSCFSLDEFAHQIVEATAFERYLDRKFPGMKRFSIEGLESLIPSIKQIIKATQSANIVIGMAHRGRLNLLKNVMQKPLHMILEEFSNRSHLRAPCSELSYGNSGDVKYHMGWSQEVWGKNVELLPNPSHLESINGVVLGRARNIIDNKQSVLPIIVHGDASLSGQGVVMETLAMSQLEGYSTGGSIHIVANNQIGFTATPSECRSTTYCTDIAKFISAPVIHVSAYDIPELMYSLSLANKYRETFHKDIFIDIIGHRLHGHNEGDEPRFSNPEIYKSLDGQVSIGEKYFTDRCSDGSIKYKEAIKRALSDLEAANSTKENQLSAKSANKVTSDFCSDLGEQEKADILNRCKAATILPKSIVPHTKISAQFQKRGEMLDSSSSVDCDWGAGEFIAFGAMLHRNINIRLSGQDASRGTFAHRHASVHCQKTGSVHYPLATINPTARFMVYNSHLSEFGVMSFEYGYSANPFNTITIWEAQFGDFVNGAQIIIDQYISSAKAKWGQSSNLTLLLPHGYEGQGPEHSSARLERFLQMCTNNNMRVCNCSTPASFANLLLSQVNSRVPLIVMTPKSKLRVAKSKLTEFFKDFAPTIIKHSPNCDIKRIILCSGKISMDLEAMLQKDNTKDIALIALEQIYPFPANDIEQYINQHPASQIVWCQEEPMNMGAYSFIRDNIQSVFDNIGIDRPLIYIGRPSSEATATGYSEHHKKEEEAIMRDALSSAP